jgi:hypothetical protein
MQRERIRSRKLLEKKFIKNKDTLSNLISIKAFHPLESLKRHRIAGQLEVLFSELTISSKRRR